MHARATIMAVHRAHSAMMISDRSNQGAISEAPLPVVVQPLSTHHYTLWDPSRHSLGSSDLHPPRLLAINSASATSLSLPYSVTNHASTSLFSTKSRFDIDPMASPSTSSTTTTSTSASNRDGVRKKNAKIYIPEERDVATIERMMKECTNDEQMKELRMHKRLLTNRQAALRSRNARKLKMEELEHQNQEVLARATFWQNRCRQVQHTLTRENNALKAENSELKATRQTWTLPLSPRDTPTVASSHLAAGYMDYTKNNSDHLMLSNSGYGAVANHHQPRDGSMQGHNMLQAEVYYPTYGTINPQHITSGMATTVLEDQEDLETMPGTLY